jgi:hypothetical protein
MGMLVVMLTTMMLGMSSMPFNIRFNLGAMCPLIIHLCNKGGYGYVGRLLKFQIQLFNFSSIIGIWKITSDYFLSLIGLFLILASWFLKNCSCFDLSLHYCKFVCFVCDKNLGALLILCSMFVNLFFWCLYYLCFALDFLSITWYKNISYLVIKLKESI